MEAVYFGTWNATRSGWCGGASPGLGPFVLADLEDGLWGCNATHASNPLVLPMTSDFVVGMVKGGTDVWGIKAGDATTGPLRKSWEGPRPPGYSPMRKQGSIILGIGGDNSVSFPPPLAAPPSLLSATTPTDTSRRLAPHPRTNTTG